MGLICSCCDRDLTEIGQCNMSDIPEVVLCEDCARNYVIEEGRESVWQDFEEEKVKRFEAREYKRKYGVKVWEDL